MTISKADTAPPHWVRIETTNNYLYAISQYLTENEIVAELSGAVTNGVMDAIAGPFGTFVAFEKPEDADAFVEWMKSSHQQELKPGSIFIANERLWAEEHAADIEFIRAARQQRGSKVESLPGATWDTTTPT